jgi:hypothetical protein
VVMLLSFGSEREIYFFSSVVHSALLFPNFFFSRPLLQSSSLFEEGWPVTDCRLMNPFLVFA